MDTPGLQFRPEDSVYHVAEFARQLGLHEVGRVAGDWGAELVCFDDEHLCPLGAESVVFISVAPGSKRGSWGRGGDGHFVFVGKVECELLLLEEEDVLPICFRDAASIISRRSRCIHKCIHAWSLSSQDAISAADNMTDSVVGMLVSRQADR